MDVNQKLKLYFFDPQNDEEQYSQLFYQLTKQAGYKAYSPLYLLRRHILLLSKPSSAWKHQIPYLPALILMQIAIAGFVKGIKYPQNYEEFYARYLNKDPIQMLGMRLLRNSLEHNNYQLFTRCKNGDRQTGKSFTQLKKFLIDSGQVTQTDCDSKDAIKVTFILSPKSEVMLVEPPTLTKQFQTYLLVNFLIRPFQLIKKFNDGMVSIEGVITNNPALKKQFDESITVDNWMKVKN